MTEQDVETDNASQGPSWSNVSWRHDMKERTEQTKFKAIVFSCFLVAATQEVSGGLLGAPSNSLSSFVTMWQMNRKE